jgi:hypothetical protein
MIQLRSLHTNQVVPLPGAYAIEVVDQAGCVGLAFLPDHARQAVDIISLREDPEAARRYALATGVEFSQVMAPPLDKLQATAPIPNA